MTVVAAFKFHKFVALGYASGKAQGAHGGFCTGVDHAYHFHAGHGGKHSVGQGYFRFAGGTKAGTIIHSMVQGSAYFGVGVA